MALPTPTPRSPRHTAQVPLHQDDPLRGDRVVMTTGAWGQSGTIRIERGHPQGARLVP